MSGEHREAKLAFPDAQPGTCRYCGKPIPGGTLRMHPACRKLFEAQKDYRGVALKKAGRMKHCALAHLGGCSQYNARTGDGLEADHRQRLIDRGPKEKTRLLCKRHHAHKTIAENRKDHHMARQRRQAQEAHGSRVTGVILLILAHAVILGVAWFYRLLDHVVLVFIGELVVVAVCMTLGLVHRVRSSRKQALVIKLADYLNIADIRPKTLRKVRWGRGGTPEAGEVEYGLEFNDREGHPDREKAESYITQLAGRTTGFDWVTHKNLLRWFPMDGRPEVVEPTEVVTAADRQHRRVTDSISAELPDSHVVVTQWDGNHPVRLEVYYPAARAKQVMESQVEITTAIAAVEDPRGQWHFTQEKAQDRFIVIDRPDPLNASISLPRVAPMLDLEVGPVIGIDEFGRPWTEPVIGKSTLLAGESGAGKGSIQWGMIRGIVPMVNEGLVKLWVWNPKMMEFSNLEGVAYRYADDADDMFEMFREAVAELREAQKVFKASRTRKHAEPTVDNPAHFLLIDELADVVSYGERAQTKENDKNLRILITQARAAGWGLLAGLQDPRVDTVKMRPLFTRAIAMRLGQRNQPDMVLGEGMRARGALCDLIKPDMQGTAYVVNYEGNIQPKRVRAAFTTDAEVDRIENDLRQGVAA